jgi:hypothetical protein
MRSHKRAYPSTYRGARLEDRHGGKMCWDSVPLQRRGSFFFFLSRVLHSCCAAHALSKKGTRDVLPPFSPIPRSFAPRAAGPGERRSFARPALGNHPATCPCLASGPSPPTPHPPTHAPQPPTHPISPHSAKTSNRVHPQPANPANPGKAPKWLGLNQWA